MADNLDKLGFVNDADVLEVRDRIKTILKDNPKAWEEQASVLKRYQRYLEYYNTILNPTTQWAMDVNLNGEIDKRDLELLYQFAVGKNIFYTWIKEQNNPLEIIREVQKTVQKLEEAIEEIYDQSKIKGIIKNDKWFSRDDILDQEAPMEDDVELQILLTKWFLDVNCDRDFSENGLEKDLIDWKWVVIGRKKGQIKTDNIYNKENMMAIYNHILGIESITDPGEIWAADINGDGIIDLKDLEMLKLYTADKTLLGDINHDGRVDEQDYINFNLEEYSLDKDFNIIEEENQTELKLNNTDKIILNHIVHNKYRGDFNLDGKVDQLDVEILQNYLDYLESNGEKKWTKNPANLSEEEMIKLADLNLDGTINSNDLLILTCIAASGNYKFGDINSDGVFDIKDIEKLEQFLTPQEESEEITLTTLERYVADVNNDNKIDNTDLKILKENLYSKRKGILVDTDTNKDQPTQEDYDALKKYLEAKEQKPEKPGSFLWGTDLDSNEKINDKDLEVLQYYLDGYYDINESGKTTLKDALILEEIFKGEGSKYDFDEDGDVDSDDVERFKELVGYVGESENIYSNKEKTKKEYLNEGWSIEEYNETYGLYGDADTYPHLFSNMPDGFNLYISGDYSVQHYMIARLKSPVLNLQDYKYLEIYSCYCYDNKMYDDEISNHSYSVEALLNRLEKRNNKPLRKMLIVDADKNKEDPERILQEFELINNKQKFDLKSELYKGKRVQIELTLTFIYPNSEDGKGHGSTTHLGLHCGYISGAKWVSENTKEQLQDDIYDLNEDGVVNLEDVELLGKILAKINSTTKEYKEINYFEEQNNFLEAWSGTTYRELVGDNGNIHENTQASYEITSNKTIKLAINYNRGNGCENSYDAAQINCGVSLKNKEPINLFSSCEEIIISINKLKKNDSYSTLYLDLLNQNKELIITYNITENYNYTNKQCVIKNENMSEVKYICFRYVMKKTSGIRWATFNKEIIINSIKLKVALPGFKEIFNLTGSLDIINMEDIKIFKKMVTPLTLGDLNCDEIIDVEDYKILSNLINEKTEISIANGLGDLNCDGKLDIEDLIILNKKVFASKLGDIDDDNVVDYLNYWVLYDNIKKEKELTILPKFLIKADLNFDNKIDKIDLDILYGIMEHQFGDINLDGKVDIRDCLLAWEYYTTSKDNKLELQKFYPHIKNLIDVNKNGVIDLNDIDLIHLAAGYKLGSNCKSNNDYQFIYDSLSQTERKDIYINIPKITLRLPGDVNGDNVVTPLDATLVLKHDVELIALDEESFKAADINNDNKVDNFDAILIYRIANNYKYLGLQLGDINFDGKIDKNDLIDLDKIINEQKVLSDWELVACDFYKGDIKENREIFAKYLLDHYPELAEEGIISICGNFDLNEDGVVDEADLQIALSCVHHTGPIVDLLIEIFDKVCKIVNKDEVFNFDKTEGADNSKEYFKLLKSVEYLKSYLTIGHIKGDIDNSGDVDKNDLIKLREYLNKTLDLDSDSDFIALWAADINNDGDIDEKDFEVFANLLNEYNKNNNLKNWKISYELINGEYQARYQYDIYDYKFNESFNEEGKLSVGSLLSEQKKPKAKITNNKLSLIFDSLPKETLHLHIYIENDVLKIKKQEPIKFTITPPSAWEKDEDQQLVYIDFILKDNFKEGYNIILLPQNSIYKNDYIKAELKDKNKIRLYFNNDNYEKLDLHLYYNGYYNINNNKVDLYPNVEKVNKDTVYIPLDENKAYYYNIEYLPWSIDFNRDKIVDIENDLKILYNLLKGLKKGENILNLKYFEKINHETLGWDSDGLVLLYAILALIVAITLLVYAFGTLAEGLVGENSELASAKTELINELKKSFNLFESGLGDKYFTLEEITFDTVFDASFAALEELAGNWKIEYNNKYTKNDLLWVLDINNDGIFDEKDYYIFYNLILTLLPEDVYNEEALDAIKNLLESSEKTLVKVWGNNDQSTLKQILYDFNYNGYITQKDANILEAHIRPRYMGTLKYVPNAIPTATDYFAFKNYLTADQKITLSPGRIKGDINGDGEINILDLNVLENYLNGVDYYTLDELDFWAADINNDGKIEKEKNKLAKDQADYITLKNYIDTSGNLPSNIDYYSNWLYDEINNIYYQEFNNPKLSTEKIVERKDSLKDIIDIEIQEGKIIFKTKEFKCPIIEISISLKFINEKIIITGGYYNEILAFWDMNKDGIVNEEDLKILYYVVKKNRLGLSNPNSEAGHATMEDLLNLREIVEDGGDCDDEVKLLLDMNKDGILDEKDIEILERIAIPKRYGHLTNENGVFDDIKIDEEDEDIINTYLTSFYPKDKAVNSNLWNRMNCDINQVVDNKDLKMFYHIADLPKNADCEISYVYAEEAPKSIKDFDNIKEIKIKQKYINQEIIGPNNLKEILIPLVQDEITNIEYQDIQIKQIVSLKLTKISGSNFKDCEVILDNNTNINLYEIKEYELNNLTNIDNINIGKGIKITECLIKIAIINYGKE